MTRGAFCASVRRPNTQGTALAVDEALNGGRQRQTREPRPTSARKGGVPGNPRGIFDRDLRVEGSDLENRSRTARRCSSIDKACAVRAVSRAATYATLTRRTV